MLSASIIFIILIIQIIFAILAAKQGVRIRFYREIAFTVFTIYFIVLLNVTLNIGMLLRGSFPCLGNINLIPIKGIIGIISTKPFIYIMMNLLGNIILMLPLGFGLALLFHKHASVLHVGIAGLLVSLTIECLQSLTFRGFDVDDILLNTTGSILGYLAFSYLHKHLPAFTECFSDIQPKEADSANA